MIILERSNSFVMVEQHEHAQLSGQLAEHWAQPYRRDESRWPDVIEAIYEHDVAWKDVDESPFFNDVSAQPYSFMDFPVRPKLVFYRRGVDLVCQNNPYAALLCSLHFVSFFKLDSTPIERKYKQDEQERQKEIIRQLQLDTGEHSRVTFHLDLLQLHDNLSLYACMNEPGTSKEEEFEWYKRGFKQTFAEFSDQTFQAEWKNEHSIVLEPFPYDQVVNTSLTFKEVRKTDIASFGLQQAYRQASIEWRKLQFISG